MDDSSTENAILPKLTNNNPYLNSSSQNNEVNNSIKNFWSPELKKEKHMRKYEYDKNQRLQNEIKSLRSQMNHIKTSNSDDYLINDLRTQNEALKDTLTEMENRLDIQQHTLEQRDASIKRLISTLQNQGIINNSSQIDSETSNALFEANVKNSELQAQLLRANDKIQELEEKLDLNLNAPLSSTNEKRLSDYYRQHANLLKEKLDATLLELKESKEAQFYSTTNNTQATITQLELTIDTLKQQNFTLSKNHDMLKSDCDNILAKNQQKQAQIDQLIQNEQKKRLEFQEINSKYKQCTTLNQVKDDKIELLSRKVMNLETALEECEKKNEKLEVEVGDSKIGDKDATIQTLERALTNKEKTFERLISEHEKEVLELQDQIESEKRSLNKTKTDLRNCKEELEFLQIEAKTNNTPPSVGEITKDLALMTQQRDSFKKQTENLQQDILSLTSQIKSSTSEQKRLLSLLEKSKQEIDSERKRADLFQQDMQSKSTPDKFHMTHLQNAMNAATEKLQQQVQKTNEYESRLRKEQKNLEKLKQSTTALCDELKSSQEALRTAKQRFSNSKSEIENLKAEKKLLTDRVARAKDDYLQMSLSEKDDLIDVLKKLNAPKNTLQQFIAQKESLVLQLKENNKEIMKNENDSSTSEGTWT